MWLFHRNREIQEKIKQYLHIYQEALQYFQQSMHHYIQHRIDDHYFRLIEQTHQSESQADDLRREIESELFLKMLLPEIREDISRIIEALDLIPTWAEKSARRIYTHHIILPEKYNAKIQELVDLGTTCGYLLKEGVEDVLTQCRRIREIARKIDANESICDHIEYQLLYDIFHDQDLPTTGIQQLLYRDMVLWIAALPDLAEKTCDQLTIFAIKRHV